MSYVRLYMCVFVRAFLSVCVYAWRYISPWCMYIFIDVHIYTYMYVHTYICTYMAKFMRIYVYIYIYMLRHHLVDSYNVVAVVLVFQVLTS